MTADLQGSQRSQGSQGSQGESCGTPQAGLQEEGRLSWGVGVSQGPTVLTRLPLPSVDMVGSQRGRPVAQTREVTAQAGLRRLEEAL